MLPFSRLSVYIIICGMKYSSVQVMKTRQRSVYSPGIHDFFLNIYIYIYIERES
jgi:hypothetical protein